MFLSNNEIIQQTHIKLSVYYYSIQTHMDLAYVKKNFILNDIGIHTVVCDDDKPHIDLCDKDRKLFDLQKRDAIAIFDNTSPLWSYAGKHRVETEWESDGYLSNGMFIYYALLCGWVINDFKSPNVTMAFPKHLLNACNSLVACSLNDP